MKEKAVTSNRTPRPDSRTSDLPLSRDDFEAILDSLTDGLLVVDARNRVIGLNRAAREILDVHEKWTQGTDCASLLGSRLREVADVVQRAIDQRRPVQDIRVEVRGRSSPRRVLLFHVDIPDDLPRRSFRAVVVVRDVTELTRRLEDAVENVFVRADVGESPSPEPDNPIDPSQSVEAVLNQTDWNMAKAARCLGISRTTLYNRMKRLGLRRPPG